MEKQSKRVGEKMKCKIFLKIYRWKSIDGKLQDTNKISAREKRFVIVVD
jgi:hypothetical protein